MNKRRNRSPQTQSLEERLAAHASRLREEAKMLPPGAVRDEILLRAEQAEVAVGMSQWLDPPERGA
jgi:hypothetical protein